MAKSLRTMMRSNAPSNWNTPEEALLPLLPHIPKAWVVWEVAPGEGRLVTALRRRGYRVVAENRDFFTWEPAIWQIALTNPPFDQKVAFVRMCTAHKKPWALLLPITTLGVARIHRNLRDVEIIFLPKRIDFTGKGAPWFTVAWFTHGLEIGRQLTFPEDP